VPACSEKPSNEHDSFLARFDGLGSIIFRFGEETPLAVAHRGSQARRSRDRAPYRSGPHFATSRESLVRQSFSKCAA
jgi:hypothetical protein